MVHEGIGVVGRDLLVGELVELADHLQEQRELRVVRLQVHQNVPLQQLLAHLHVAVSRRHVQQNAEPRAQIRQALAPRGSALDPSPPRLQMHVLALSQQQLQPIAQERVVRVASHQLLVDLAVRAVLQRFQDQHHGHEELLLADEPAQRAAAVAEIVQRHRHRGHVFAHALHLAAQRRVLRASLRERRTVQRHDDVPTRHLQQADHSLQPVADEIAAQLVHFFAAIHALRGRHAAQVAAVRAHHDGELAQIALRHYDLAVVHLVSDIRDERGGVAGGEEGMGNLRDSTLSTLVREKARLARAILFDWVADLHVLDPDTEDLLVVRVLDLE